jgi:hypothetical protein
MGCDVRLEGRVNGGSVNVGVARHPRCPFYAIGVNVPQAMTACPGYCPSQLSTSVEPTNGGGSGVSCLHLGAATVSRGRYIPACHHPEGTRVVDAARTVMRRAGLRPKHDVPVHVAPSHRTS